MKQNRFIKQIIIVILFFLVVVIPATTEPDNEVHRKNRIVVRAVTIFLEQMHIHRPKINDNVSEKLFEEYFDRLDPNHYFFLASDIEEFSSSKKILDNRLQHGDVNFAFYVHQRFVKRVKQRLDYLKKRIDLPFDFTTKQNILIDRSKAPWPKDEEELDQVWHGRIKNQLLQDQLRWIMEKKEDKKQQDIPESWMQKSKQRIVKRYQRYYNEFVKKNDYYDITEMYLSTLAGIFDPHSSYMNWRTLSDVNIALKLSLQGIGAMITSEDGYPKIVSVVPGGPADKQGELKAGHRIIAVTQEDGTREEVLDMPLSKVVQKIRGKKGTKVTLTIIKSLQDVPFDITITRDKIELKEQEAKGEVKEISISGETVKVGFINIPSFYTDFAGRHKQDPNYKSTSRDVKKIIDRLVKEDKILGLVIDLRSNSGGSLEEVIELAGLFIPSGPVVQISNTWEATQVRSDDDDGFSYDLPLIVMVNTFSASASEIFAGVIQDYQRGIIVGNRTHGKGTVQNLLNLARVEALSDKKPGALKCTTSKFYRVTGESTQKKGVVPDISLPTFIDPLEYGEASLKHCLPWDKIKEVKFTKSIKNLNGHLQILQSKHQQRIKKNKQFQQLGLYLKRWKELKKIKTISLNLKDRLARQQEEDKSYKHIEEMLGESDQEYEKDLYLKESLLILQDFLMELKIIKVPEKKVSKENKTKSEDKTDIEKKNEVTESTKKEDKTDNK